MNSNEVTWEPPPELVAYQAVVAAKLAQTQAKEKAQAQQAQWAIEQAALGLTPDYPVSHKRIPSKIWFFSCFEATYQFFCAPVYISHGIFYI